MAISHDARRQRALERQAKVLELRKAGVTYDAIAQAVGYADAPAAYRAYKAALANDAFRRTADEMRDLTNRRYEALLRAMWGQAIKGTVPAVDRCLAIMRDIQRLNGTEAPQRVVLKHISRTAIQESMQTMLAEIEQMERRQAEREQAEREQAALGGAQSPIIDVDVIEREAVPINAEGN